MSNDDKQAYKKYEPEEPVSKGQQKEEMKEIRDASKHAAQEMAAEDLGKDDKPMSHEQAEKELHQAAEKVRKEEKKKQ